MVAGRRADQAAAEEKLAPAFSSSRPLAPARASQRGSKQRPPQRKGTWWRASVLAFARWLQRATVFLLVRVCMCTRAYTHVNSVHPRAGSPKASCALPCQRLCACSCQSATVFCSCVCDTVCVCVCFLVYVSVCACARERIRACVRVFIKFG